MTKRRWIVTEHNSGMVKVEEQERLWLLFVPIWYKVDRNAITFFSVRTEADEYISKRKEHLIKNDIKHREVIEL